ncbi:MAG: TIM barrel protein [Nanoarchaeota archaeon]|nr:TIM barrel protein [DPANN group archaeon]MBL7117122.1 TIM barrel protein [Nanoarchaeota archaeon]
MKKLLFGTAGIPISTPDHNTENGVRYVRELGLDCMELEFVRSINITKERAPTIKEVAKKENVVLTCHAPYFINLNAIEKPKLYASMNRILNSARIAHLCGGWSVTFHAGFYMKMEPEKVYNNIRDKIKEIRKTLDNEGVDIWLRPETTGKPTQFSGLKDLLNISQEVEGVMPCVDFAHLHARTAGKNNTTEEFRDMLQQIEKALGKEGLKNMHIHMAGINYTEKGERNHLILKESDMNYKDLLKVWKEFKIAGVVICESPNIEEDAKLLQETYRNTL